MLTQEKVHESLKYHSDGRLTWKIKRSNNSRIGKEVGTIDHYGYKVFNMCSNYYRVHRIVWFMHHGYMPENNIDHINRNKIDNRIENLREVGQQCNARNTGNFRHNKSGIKGVSWHKSAEKWEATIHVNRKKHYLGVHFSFVEAVLHRLAAEQCMNWIECDSISPAYKYLQDFREVQGFT